MRLVPESQLTRKQVDHSFAQKAKGYASQSVSKQESPNRLTLKWCKCCGLGMLSFSQPNQHCGDPRWCVVLWAHNADPAVPLFYCACSRAERGQCTVLAVTQGLRRCGGPKATSLRKWRQRSVQEGRNEETAFLRHRGNSNYYDKRAPIRRSSKHSAVCSPRTMPASVKE